jgi:uncharacterized short protein YbdD (DUF466 family)
MAICEYERDINWQKLRDDPSAQQSASIKGHGSSACQGNSIYNAIDYLYRYGVVDNNCVSREELVPFCKKQTPQCTSISEYSQDEKLPTCEQMIGLDYDVCLDGKTAARRYRCAGIYNVPPNERDIMGEIYSFGPIITGFMVYGDFTDNYDGKTIYTHPDKNSRSNGGHAVEIYGWGEKEQDNRIIKYWLIKNSWSEAYGDKGFCYIERNIPELQLEQNCASVLPDIPYLILKCIPSQIKFLQESIDDQKRKEFDVDPITGYRRITMEKIRNGELKGSLKPMISIDDVPDYCEFVAGMISNNPDDERETEEIYFHSDKVNLKKIVRGAGISLLVVLVILGVIKMIKKRR